MKRVVQDQCHPPVVDLQAVLSYTVRFSPTGLCSHVFAIQLTGKLSSRSYLKTRLKFQLHVNHFHFGVALGSGFGPIANLRQPLNFSANISVGDGDLLR